MLISNALIIMFILAIRYINNKQQSQSVSRNSYDLLVITLERSFIGGNIHQDERKYLTLKKESKQDIFQ